MTAVPHALQTEEPALQELAELLPAALVCASTVLAGLLAAIAMMASSAPMTLTHITLQPEESAQGILQALGSATRMRWQGSQEITILTATRQLAELPQQMCSAMMTLVLDFPFQEHAAFPQAQLQIRL